MFEFMHGLPNPAGWRWTAEAMCVVFAIAVAVGTQFPFRQGTILMVILVGMLLGVTVLLSGPFGWYLFLMLLSVEVPAFVVLVLWIALGVLAGRGLKRGAIAWMERRDRGKYREQRPTGTFPD